METIRQVLLEWLRDKNLSGIGWRCSNNLILVYRLCPETGNLAINLDNYIALNVSNNLVEFHHRYIGNSEDKDIGDPNFFNWLDEKLAKTIGS